MVLTSVYSTEPFGPTYVYGFEPLELGVTRDSGGGGRTSPGARIGMVGGAPLLRLVPSIPISTLQSQQKLSMSGRVVASAHARAIDIHGAGVIEPDRAAATEGHVCVWGAGSPTRVSCPVHARTASFAVGVAHTRKHVSVHFSPAFQPCGPRINGQGSVHA